MGKHIRGDGMVPDAGTMSVSSILERSERRRKRRFWRTVFIIALVVFAVSIVGLGVIGFSYLQGQQKYGKVSDVANISETAFEDVAGGSASIAELKVDWDALRAANPDTVAWVYIPGSSVNYPVVQGEDNDHYLYYDFDGDAGWLANYGAIFMDYHNHPDWSDASYFIYGHHMNDGSMFADIASFEEPVRFDECRTIYLLSPSGNFKLRSYAIVHCDSDEQLVETEFDTPKDMRAYIQDKLDRSIVVAHDLPPIKEITRSFAFATCDNGAGGRDVLFAYVEETSAEGLEGTIGINSKDGDAKGFVEDVKAK